MVVSMVGTDFIVDSIFKRALVMVSLMISRERSVIVVFVMDYRNIASVGHYFILSIASMTVPTISFKIDFVLLIEPTHVSIVCIVTISIVVAVVSLLMLIVVQPSSFVVLFLPVFPKRLCLCYWLICVCRGRLRMVAREEIMLGRRIGLVVLIGVKSSSSLVSICECIVLRVLIALDLWSMIRQQVSQLSLLLMKIAIRFHSPHSHNTIQLIDIFVVSSIILLCFFSLSVVLPSS